MTRPGLSTEESLTLEEAFAAYTTGGGFASNSESRLGTIERGKKADLVWLDRDPYEVQTEELRSVKVLRTYMDGEPVYGS